MDVFAKLPLAKSAISLILLALLLTALSLPAAPSANAESAELMKSYRQYRVLEKAGKYKEAEPHAQKALSLGEKEFGTNHQTYATLLNNLALLYGSQGRYDEAEPLYKRSLKIKKKCWEFTILLWEQASTISRGSIMRRGAMGKPSHSTIAVSTSGKRRSAKTTLMWE